MCEVVNINSAKFILFYFIFSIIGNTSVTFWKGEQGQKPDVGTVWFI